VKTAAESSARWTRSTSSVRRRRISVGMVTGTTSMVGRCRAARNPSDGGLAPTPSSDTLGGYQHATPRGGTHVSHPTTTRPEARERRFVMGPERVRVTILTTGAETDGRHDLVDCVLPAGSMTPLHLHTRYEERVYVISGSLTVWIGPDRLTVGPGEYYRIPLDVPHTVQAGSEDTRALLISSPAGFAELVARAGTPAHLATPDTEPDLERFTAVSTGLGDVTLGPPGMTPAELGRRQAGAAEPRDARSA
jgi:mannose-6-phosphate isomerase-like protein (cupin superfamily)